jgi:hypothetical protein
MTAAARPERRVVPLRDARRRSAKLSAKKPTPSFPTANQLAQVIVRLHQEATNEAARHKPSLKKTPRLVGLDLPI